MSKKFYKILHIEDGKLFSFCCLGLATVEYFENEWIRDLEWVNNGIFVFESLKNIFEYFRYPQQFLVFECEAIDEVVNPQIYSIQKLALGEKKAYTKAYVSKGTKVFKEIKLTRKISKKEILEVLPEKDKGKLKEYNDCFYFEYV